RSVGRDVTEQNAASDRDAPPAPTPLADSNTLSAPWDRPGLGSRMLAPRPMAGQGRLHPGAEYTGLTTRRSESILRSFPNRPRRGLLPARSGSLPARAGNRFP